MVAQRTPIPTAESTVVHHASRPIADFMLTLFDYGEHLVASTFGSDSDERE